jgi:hypothetical protein
MSTSEILKFVQSVESDFKAYKNEIHNVYDHYLCTEVTDWDNFLCFESFGVKLLGQGRKDQMLYDTLSDYMVQTKKLFERNGSEMSESGFLSSGNFLSMFDKQVDDSEVLEDACLKGHLEIFMSEVYEFGYEKVCSDLKD